MAAVFLEELHFSECIGDCFVAQLEGRSPLQLQLIEVTTLANAPPRQSISLERLRSLEIQQRQPFSLVFQGSRDLLLPQQTYRLDHPRLGGIDVFLVPIACHQDGMRYEAIFS